MTDERLKQLYTQAVSRREQDDRGKCVSPDTLNDLVSRRGPESERLGVLSHVMSCPDCRREFELLRSIDRGARSETKRQFPSRVLALAASVTLLVGAGLVWQVSRGGEPDVLRGPASELLLVAPAGDISGEPVEFVWRPVENATSYRLQVATQGGEVVIDSVARDTMLQLQDTEMLEEDVEYLWWIEARVDGAVTTADPRAFRVRRE